MIVNKKGTINALVWLIIAIIIVIFAFKFTAPFIKVLFGFGGDCKASYYLVDEIQISVDKIKNGEITEDIKVMGVQGKCALISFDAGDGNKDYTNRPEECYQKACLCICYIGLAGVDDNDCMNNAYCMAFEDVNGFWGDEITLNNQLYIDSDRKYNVPHYIVYDKINSIVYVSTVDQINLLGVGGGANP